VLIEVGGRPAPGRPKRAAPQDHVGGPLLALGDDAAGV